MARYSTSCPSLLRLLYSHQKTTCSMSMKWDETVTISRVLLSSNNIALSCLGRGIVDVLRIGERIKSTTRTWSIWITKGIITRHIVWQHRRSWCRLLLGVDLGVIIVFQHRPRSLLVEGPFATSSPTRSCPSWRVPLQHPVLRGHVLPGGSRDCPKKGNCPNIDKPPICSYCANTVHQSRDCKSSLSI